jgi:lipopolysaccharide transport system ATP-binding protein
MTTPAVSFEHVTKRYPRGGTKDGARYASLRHDLSSIGKRARARLHGRGAHENGTLALEDLTFDVAEGESFALVGPNGAGKSTALKLLTRISAPTAGTIRLRGRVAALMEVGSGVHPELTGRENIWLYGQILGMKKSEVRARFDEIVAFSELLHAIDTPVKFYSSGMQLRLGFSIASFLNPDIFVVDEALAVGDAGFQAKCVERMTALVREGRTLLFVSHNLIAVEALCSRSLFLLGGRARCLGETREVLAEYLAWVDAQAGEDPQRAPLVGRGLEISRVLIKGLDGSERSVFDTGEGMLAELHITSHEDVRNCWVSVGVSDGRPGGLVSCSMLERSTGVDLLPGEHLVTCRIESLPLNGRRYQVWVAIREETGAAALVDWSEAGSFRIADGIGGLDGPGRLSFSAAAGPVRVRYDWEHVRNGDASASALP